MSLIETAFESPVFYGVALVLSALFGFGALVHIGNVLGRGEFGWPDVPLRFKIADVFWGGLDVAAFVGTIVKSPIGPLSLVLAATTQIIVYAAFPAAFAPRPEHQRALRGMIALHVVVLAVLGITLYATTRS